MSLKAQGKYRFQDFEVDLAHRTLRRDGHIITISPRTFDLLIVLIANPRRIITNEELIHLIWPHSEMHEESNLSQHIFLLRKALSGGQSGEKLILTVSGRGYQFAASVAEVPEARQESNHESIPLPAPIEPPEWPHEPNYAPTHTRTLDAAVLDSEESIIQDAEEEDSPASDYDHAYPRKASLISSLLHPGPWQLLTITAALAIVGFGSFFLVRSMHRSTARSFGLVIADFENTTGNPDFDRALKTATTIDLQQSPLLSVASQSKVSQTLNAMKAGANQPLTPENARQVCSRIDGQAYLTGSIRLFARKYLISLQAFDCASGSSLAGSKGIADSPDGVVSILDKVAVDLRKQLGEPPVSIARFSKPLFSGRAASLEALKAYSDANDLGLTGKSQESVDLFQRAVEIDPQFAMAFADLGVAYSNLGQRDLATASLSRAYELRDSVDEAHRLFIVAIYNGIVSGDIQASIRNYKAWSEEYPNNPVPQSSLADLEIRIGKPALAIDPARRSLELNPSAAETYVVLAHAQLQLGQFEEAAKTCQLAIGRNLDRPEIHGFLLQIAFLRLDQPAVDEQLAWARNKPAQPYMLLQQALMDFALGKAKAAQATLANMAESERSLNPSEAAGHMLSQVPRIEAELGLTETAASLLDRLPEVPDSTDIPVAWAHVGEASRAEAILKRELDAHLTATLWQEDSGPQIRAAIDLNQHHPENAIDDLKAAVPYDLRSFDVPSLRGRAYLLAQHPELAEAEFHKILDHPGIEPLSHDYPLAQLGLARALAQEGKTVEAGFAYKLVLQIWKDADPDLPRLKEAKAEYARLGSESVPRSSPAPAAHPQARKPTASKPAASKH